MKFNEIIPGLLEGKMYKWVSWIGGIYIKFDYVDPKYSALEEKALKEYGIDDSGHIEDLGPYVFTESDFKVNWEEFEFDTNDE